jgi:NADH-quinone oxidoreductase subunit M
MFLTQLIFLPLVFAIVISFVDGHKLAKQLTLAFTVIQFLFSLKLFYLFDANSAALQLVEKHNWISSIGVQYFVAVDGISFWLILLTTLITPLALLGAWESVDKKEKAFCISILVLETTMLGTFLSLNAILFYCFFEASLIPMYFIIGVWGGARRLYATMKFFIYTMAGSIFMLLGIVALMFMTTSLPGGHMSANITDFYQLKIPFVAGEFFNTQSLLFFSFALAFAIKVPVFPFHTWLPDAHVEAPTAGSVILAAVLLKMGTYGFLRFVIPIFPEATEQWSWIFMLIGAFGIIYGALVAMVQPDIKKLVAYSSVSHMGYIMIGMFAFNIQGVTGALYQMLNHGVSTGALFLLVGMIYERTHTREIKDYGGLASAAPIFTIFFIIVTVSSIAAPLTNGFIGEFLILLGTFLKDKYIATVSVAGVVLGAAYMLWMVKRVFFGEEAGVVLKYKDHGLDLKPREIFVLTPLVILIFWMGLLPNHFFKWSEASITNLIESKGNYVLNEYKEMAKEINPITQPKVDINKEGEAHGN